MIRRFPATSEGGSIACCTPNLPPARYFGNLTLSLLLARNYAIRMLLRTSLSGHARLFETPPPQCPLRVISGNYSANRPTGLVRPEADGRKL